MIRTISRRLERLEARAGVGSTTKPVSLLIEFVNSEKRVTSTLLMERGKVVWTKRGDYPGNISHA
jgi:hypothetical protein